MKFLLSSLVIGNLFCMLHGMEGYFKSAIARGTARYVMLNAAYYGDLEHMKILHTLGVSYDCAGEAGATPLIDAVRAENIEIVDFLCTQSVQINKKDIWDKTALFYAVSRGSQYTVQKLLAAGASTDCKDWKGRTVLHEAALRGFHAILQNILMVSSVCLDDQDKEGNTPLMVAAQHSNNRGSTRSVQHVLIEAGADVCKYGSVGYTPLMHAIMLDVPLVWDIMRLPGSDRMLSQKDSITGQTVIDIARSKARLLKDSSIHEVDNALFWEKFIEYCRKNSLHEALQRTKQSGPQQVTVTSFIQNRMVGTIK